MSRSLLGSHWPKIRAQLKKARRILLLLDYDGTLTPIVGHPTKARLCPQTKRLLQKLARRPEIRTALVSGRKLSDLKRMVGVIGLCYVGNHGLELQGPRLTYVNPTARRSRPILKKIAQELRKTLRAVPGAWVEDKGLTLTLHCRQVPDGKVLLVRNGFHAVTRPYRRKRQIRISSGKRVFEVRPPVRWTKGTIVSWLLARQKAVTGGKPVLPIYIGDDVTDEDAFRVLRPRGITVAVGSSTRLTRAEYAVDSPADVRRFLAFLTTLS